MHTCIHTYMNTRQRNILAYMHTDIYAYRHICIHTYKHTHIHDSNSAAHMYTYTCTKHTHMHTYIRNIHTCIHTYIHRDTETCYMSSYMERRGRAEQRRDNHHPNVLLSWNINGHLQRLEEDAGKWQAFSLSMIFLPSPIQITHANLPLSQDLHACISGPSPTRPTLGVW
jgi:hypothetical protein